MARPIKETPVLSGSDARRFEKAIKENAERKVPRESYERAINVFRNIKIAEKKLLGA